MPSAAFFLVDALERAETEGRKLDPAALARAYGEIPPAQFRVYFADLCGACPDRVVLGVERRPGNALNIEIGAPAPRCALQSPDGRGLAWVRSGGSWLAYGLCQKSTCPRAART